MQDQVNATPTPRRCGNRCNADSNPVIADRQVMAA